MKTRNKPADIFSRPTLWIGIFWLLLTGVGCQSVPGFSLLSDETALYRPSVIERAAIRSNLNHDEQHHIRVTLEEEKEVSFFEKVKNGETPIFLSEDPDIADDNIFKLPEVEKVLKATVTGASKRINSESTGSISGCKNCYQLTIRGKGRGVAKVFYRAGKTPSKDDKVFIVEIK